MVYNISIMKNKAFTLIELLVTVAIISLLSSIVFASLSNAREKANVAKTVVQSKEIEKAIELGRLSNNSLPRQLDDTKSIKDIVASSSQSSLKTAIAEYYTGDIPDIPVTVGGDENEYYYFSDGELAVDGEGRVYSCGVNVKEFRTSPNPGQEKSLNIGESVIFYKEDRLLINPEDDDLDYYKNVLFYTVPKDSNVSDPAYSDGSSGTLSWWFDYEIHGSYIEWWESMDYALKIPYWEETPGGNKYVFRCN